MGFLEEQVFIQEMLQQNSSKVCSGLCPKATKPAFSSGLGFFSALTNFVSQHPWEGKSAFCSFINRRGKRDIKIPVVQQEAALGTPWRGKGGVWSDALGTSRPLLTLPTLTSSHKFIPSKFRATKLWESCFGREAEDLFAANLFGELFFVPLQPAHGPAIAATPHQF